MLLNYVDFEMSENANIVLYIIVIRCKILASNSLGSAC